MTQAVEMWLMAQMKAYSMLMKNWALICGLGHLRKEILNLWMWVPMKSTFSTGFFFSRFFRVSGSENTLVPWVFSRNPWVFSRNSWVFWNFLEFFHKLLEFLQIFSEKVVRHWQNLNYIALIQAKRTIFHPKM